MYRSSLNVNESRVVSNEGRRDPRLKTNISDAHLMNCFYSSMHYFFKILIFFKGTLAVSMWGTVQVQSEENTCLKIKQRIVFHCTQKLLVLEACLKIHDFDDGSRKVGVRLTAALLRHCYVPRAFAHPCLNYIFVLFLVTFLGLESGSSLLTG